jgi:hypothetical protein
LTQGKNVEIGYRGDAGLTSSDIVFLQNELNAGRYVLASTELTFSKERHAIVITGYYYENSSIIYTFFDPASASYKKFYQWRFIQ